MKTITFFYLANCPYCHDARRALAELSEEDPAYATISVDWIEESQQAELANQYDYYYVPSIFADGKKLYEVNPSEDYASIKNNVKEALDIVLQH